MQPAPCPGFGLWERPGPELGGSLKVISSVPLTLSPNILRHGCLGAFCNPQVWEPGNQYGQEHDVPFSIFSLVSTRRGHRRGTKQRNSSAPHNVSCPHVLSFGSKARPSLCVSSSLPLIRNLSQPPFLEARSQVLAVGPS